MTDTIIRTCFVAWLIGMGILFYETTDRCEDNLYCAAGRFEGEMP